MEDSIEVFDKLNCLSLVTEIEIIDHFTELFY